MWRRTGLHPRAGLVGGGTMGNLAPVPRWPASQGLSLGPRLAGDQLVAVAGEVADVHKLRQRGSGQPWNGTGEVAAGGENPSCARPRYGPKFPTSLSLSHDEE